MIILYFIIVTTIYFITNRKLKIPAYWFIILLGILSIIVFFPGVYQDDTSFLYEEYQTGIYSDWQPPIYTMWWHIFQVRVAEFIINVIVYYSGVSYISYMLYKDNKKWQNDLLVLFSFYPLYFTQLIICLKDVPYTGFLVLAISSLISLNTNISKIKKLILVTIVIVSTFLAVGFKYNGIFAILPILTYTIYTLIPQKYKGLNKFIKNSITISITIAIAGLMIISLNLITYKVFEAKRSYSPILFMYNDLANIECQLGSEIIPDNFFIQPERRSIMCNPFFINLRNYEPLTTENWSGAQNPAILIYNDQIDSNFYNQVKSTWFHAISQNLVTYLKYRSEFLYNIIFTQWWWTPLDPNASNNIIQTSLASLAIEERSLLATFNGMFLLIGTILSFLYVITRKNNHIALIIITSSIMQLISLYLVLGVPAARFFLWNYLAIILSIALTKNSSNKLNNKKVTKNELPKT